MGAEDEEWQSAESEQKAILAGTAPVPAVGAAASAADDLPAPEFEGAGPDGYLADQLAPPLNGNPAAAPAGEEAVVANGEAALGAAERRRSMAGEDAEWAEAEKEVAAGLAAGS